MSDCEGKGKELSDCMSELDRQIRDLIEKRSKVWIEWSLLHPKIGNKSWPGPCEFCTK